jgi:rhodanese-related sulfurtransferase
MAWPPQPMTSIPASAFVRDLTVIAALATASLVVGWGLDRTRSHPLPWLYVSPAARVQEAAAALDPRPSAVPDGAVRVIGLAEFRAFVEGKRGLVLDARPAVFYELGHVPGALNVARAEFGRDYAAQRAALEAGRSGPLAVYCSGLDCEDSQMVANALAQLGYRPVLVFRGGWDEWTQAGLPAGPG